MAIISVDDVCESERDLFSKSAVFNGYLSNLNRKDLFLSPGCYLCFSSIWANEAKHWAPYSPETPDAIVNGNGEMEIFDRNHKKRKKESGVDWALFPDQISLINAGLEIFDFMKEVRNLPYQEILTTRYQGFYNGIHKKYNLGIGLNKNRLPLYQDLIIGEVINPLYCHMNYHINCSEK
nr:hypothetical protein [Candidatus Woesearchaeota archaeon]